jgi:hypothetical protein
VVVCRDRSGQEPRIDRQWNPQLVVALGKVEIRWHHADHFVLDSTQVDGAADDRWIAAEPPSPQAVAQQDDAVVVDPCLILGE